MPYTLRTISTITILLARSYFCLAQETVFALLKGDEQLAREYFAENNFASAVDLYRKMDRKNPTPVHALEIGRCYYAMKEYALAAESFGLAAKNKVEITSPDLYLYAESLASDGQYRKAIEVYRMYAQRAKEDSIVQGKIWRLSNIQYLYEDSLHYAIRRLQLCDGSSEIYPKPFNHGIVFLSNRKQVEPVGKEDRGARPLFKAYYSKILSDSTGGQTTQYATPEIFGQSFLPRWQVGPICFFQNDTRAVFSASGDKTDEQGKLPLQLYFAELSGNSWKVTGAFPFNKSGFTMTDPWISADGSTLYFSSDMPGGIGGRDLYRAEYENGQWSIPQNLGRLVNTTRDEIGPFMHNGQTLYFSSNGLPGMGGYDVFKLPFTKNDAIEPMNMGYPVNSSKDDHGFILDHAGTHGYVASNRRAGGLDDDLYEIDIDLQTYPLTIEGLIRIKEHSWSDSSELKPFANASIILIDANRDIAVARSQADNIGNFTFQIPYFSRYKITITGSDSEEYLMSLDLAKRKKDYGRHEIVIVRDLYR